MRDEFGWKKDWLSECKQLPQESMSQWTDLPLVGDVVGNKAPTEQFFRVFNATLKSPTKMHAGEQRLMQKRSQIICSMKSNSWSKVQFRSLMKTETKKGFNRATNFSAEGLQ